MYTGHVTAGGSICLEALTCSGTPGSWQPDFTVESLLNVIVVNMVRLDTISYWIQHSVGCCCFHHHCVVRSP
jgi:ubiquitin-protein ligase